VKKGWQTKTLGDVCHVYQPETISQKQMIAGECRVYGANGQIGWHNQFNHEEPELILGCRGSCGTVHVTEPRSWINGNAMVVHPTNGAMDISFLSYALKGGIELADAITGAAQPQITRTSLMPLVISFPESLAEQQRIIGLLDEAFEGLATAKANAEKNLQNARALFESHLDSVFTQRGSGWVEKALGDFCSFENGDRGVNYPSKSARTATGIPFINAGHLADDGIDLETMDYIPRKRFDLLSNGKIRKGDILFCLRGSLGKFASVGNLAEGAIASSLVIVRPDKTVLNDFLVAYFRSPLCTAMINRFKNGAAQPNLSAQSLRNFIAPVPSLEKQASLVGQLTDLRKETQRLAQIYEQKLEALESLKKSILHEAFSGNL